MTPLSEEQRTETRGDEARLDEIARALCRPLLPEERKALRREYLRIWDELEGRTQ